MKENSMNLSNLVRAASAAALTAGVGLVATSGVASAAPFAPTAHQVHALFVESESTSGDNVLSYWRSSDGTVSYAGTYATGGDGATAVGATADPLASQGGLTLINNNTELVAVNSLSDTVSVFAVNGPHLTLLQQVASEGQFPDSVASDGNLVAVLNAGGSGSVAEFRLFGDSLVALPGQVRNLGLLLNSNPPDFHHGVGEVAYTPNGQHLIITTKLTSNAFDVFSVGFLGNLGASPVVTASDVDLPFSFTFDSAGNVVAAEASPSSVSTYSVNNNGTLTSLGTVGENQTALCWISGANGYFYGSNAGSGTVSSFNESATGAPQLVNATAATAHAGTIDSAVSPNGQTLYVESGGAGTIDAYSIGSGGVLTQLETIFNVPLASEGIAVS
jgi:6-phosphogluconolactonase (cycloisomerase 2 family)